MPDDAIQLSDLAKITMTALLSFAAGFIIAVFAEPARRWLFSSAVTLSFEPKIGFGRRWICLTNTNTDGVASKYIRVLARCSSRMGVTANRCTPFLTKIEKHDPTNNDYRELHHDPIPLNWAYIGEQQLDIHPQTEFYFDVLEVNSKQNLLRPQTTISPETWAQLLQKPGKYKFSVMLSGENIGPVRRSIEFEWKGSFDSLTEDCF